MSHSYFLGIHISLCHCSITTINIYWRDSKISFYTKERIQWVTPKCRPCRLQTVPTMQTEYFFLTLGSLFSVLQLHNSVQYFLMFVIYPQAVPHKLNIQLLIQQRNVFNRLNLYGEFPLLVLNKII